MKYISLILAFMCFADICKMLWFGTFSDRMSTLAYELVFGSFFLFFSYQGFKEKKPSEFQIKNLEENWQIIKF